MTRGRSCLRAGFCGGGASEVADAIHRCAARLRDGPARRRCTTPAGRRRCGGGGGTPFPAQRPPRHGNVAVRAPVRARGHGAGRRTPYLCVGERATALKARVLHVRAWNSYCGGKTIRA